MGLRSWAYFLIMGQIVIAVLLYFFLPISGATMTSADKSDLLMASLTQGQVKGRLATSFGGKDYVELIGIPYAEPPVGKLRFARPVPAKSWEGIRNGAKFHPVCPQPELETLFRDRLNDPHKPDDRKGRLRAIKVVGEEDCLYLNIYQPVSCRQRGCAVMVWFHGGAFQVSDALPSTFGPSLFMDHEIVLVTVNYRLGVLGFLTLDVEAAPGNLGLRDQALALEWVKREARQFGGDPDKITIFGSGAGAESTIYQLVSPLNKGKHLFGGVICQSGTPIGDPVLNHRDRRQNAVALAASLACSGSATEDTLSCLQSKSAEDLVRAGLEQLIHNPAVWIGRALSLSPWRPAIDGDSIKDPFLPDKPEVLLMSKDDDDQGIEPVPAILGSTTEESISTMSPFLAHPVLMANFTETLATNMFGISPSQWSDRTEDIARYVKKLYIPDGRIQRIYIPNAIIMLSDFAYNGPLGLTAKLLSNLGTASKNGSVHGETLTPLTMGSNSVYHYIYRYSMCHSVGDLTTYSNLKLSMKMFFQNYGITYNMRSGHGISHGDELFLMFSPFGKFPKPMGTGPISERDKHLSKHLLWMWTNFAKVRKPTPKKIDAKTNNLFRAAMKGQFLKEKTPGDFLWEPLQDPDRKYAIMSSEFDMKSNPDFWRRVANYEKVLKVADFPNKMDQKFLSETDRAVLAELADSYTMPAIYGDSTHIKTDL